MNFLQHHHLRLIKGSSQALRVSQGCCPALVLEPGKEKLENKGKLIFKIALGCSERSFSKPAHSKLLLTSPGIITWLLPAQETNPTPCSSRIFLEFSTPPVSAPQCPHPPCSRQVGGITKPTGVLEEIFNF